jgi:cysteine-S-conjugate beta-lyase
MTEAYDDLTAENIYDAHSIKWNYYERDVLPLWVADMDFLPAPEILSALKTRVDTWLGYSSMAGNKQLLEGIVAHMASFGWTGLDPKNIWLVSGVVPGMYASVLGLSSVNDEIITQTPIYPPFMSSIKDHGRKMLENKMLIADHKWVIDFDNLETLITPGTRILMICNPHNPTGRVFTQSELEKLAAFVLKHRLYVISDELHANLILEPGMKHIPFASLSPEISDRTVTITGPCKTFTTAGLGIGAVISTNTKLLERIQAATKGLMGHPNVMSETAWLAGLEVGMPWLEQTKTYLHANREFLGAYLTEHLPKVRCILPEATYLAWLDFNEYQQAPEVQKFLLETAKVGLNEGTNFGADYTGFVRLNFATSRQVLTQALERIRLAVTT